jgi:putative phosphoribosyl transferase
MFADRTDAGAQLGARLATLDFRDPVVLALPRGGVAVGYEVARALHADLDVIVVRKLGVPFQPELAMGAIGEDGVLIVDEGVVRAAGLSGDDVARVEARERVELERRVAHLRELRERVPLAQRTAIIVDDGVATGSTARAACLVARAHGALQVVLAVPIGARSSLESLSTVADGIVCLDTPDSFFAVGQWYRHFAQVHDSEVVALLARAQIDAVPDNGGDPEGGRGEVVVETADARLPGVLTIPDNARGIVVFAHGSASSRHSPRNRFVAEMLQHAGIGTLLFDLLTDSEEQRHDNVFDIELLSRRLSDATHWLHRARGLREYGIGYFGASTGAAAAMWSAAEPDVHVDAVVSRGGRPDLAIARLGGVRAPTLLIVGGEDFRVLGLNGAAESRLRCECRLAVIPGATHLFEEPGALDEVAHLAREWFVRHLSPIARRAG